MRISPWLGIEPDLFARQSDRKAQHDTAADRLRAAGRLYPMLRDPRRSWSVAASASSGRNQPPIYDRAALKLTAEERATPGKTMGGDRTGASFWRPRTVTWDDLVRGPAHVDCASLSDPVLIRGDGSYLYTLPSVVDDAELGITHVIRGEDHVTNTGVQVQIFEALGAAVPIFGHHNLLTTADGEGLSKRLGHLSLRGLREAGYEPAAVRSLAVLTGSAESVRAVPDLDPLAGLIDLAEISRGRRPGFDTAELDGLNARLVHAMPYADVFRSAGGPWNSSGSRGGVLAGGAGQSQPGRGGGRVVAGRPRVRSSRC